ncbi:MAG: hypothetical protein M0011_10450 [Elusimicrobia bacterium]|nr:hypothetical protein [Elusimicrobiota bacterium]
MNNSLVRAAALALFLPLAGTCSAGDAAVAQPPGMSSLEAYRYDPSSKLEDRIGPPPDVLLKQYREIDGRPDYGAYAPTEAEKRLVIEYLGLMPPVAERVFREKCVGLYFVSGFMGNGMTSWVADSTGTVYFSMVLNPKSLKQSLSETLSERENSCFVPAEGWKVTVDAGSKYRGLAYALFHEGAHAVDYIRGVTPFVDPGMPEGYRAPFRGDGGLFTGVWKEYSVPMAGNDYAGRSDITFYGLGGPKIPAAQAPGLYAGLVKSPFVSLYGSRSWAEDLAELTAYGLIAGRLGQPYKISLKGPGVRKTISPMKGRAASRSAAALKLLEKL